MPSSSWSSRIRLSSGRSPGSSLPPGNSQRPASVLPSGRCAIRTRLSTSISAQATTSVSLRSAMPWSAPNDDCYLRPVVAVDRDILLGEVAGQHAIAALAEAKRDLDLDLRVLHHLGYVGLVVGRIARAAFGDSNAVERDRKLVAVG